MTDLIAVRTVAQPVLDVVFIHGLDGDGRATWQHDGAESFWPDWLADDIGDACVWSIDYDAGSTKWRRGRGMAIQDRAVNLMVQMQNYGLGERGLCFIAHSMGGLLVKEILLHAAESRGEFARFATATAGVVFLSTPHTGAAVANALGVLPYRRSAAAKALIRNDPYLRHLNDRYRDWATDSGIENLVFYETLPTKSVRVVDETSANPGIPLVRPIPIDADHIRISKPTGRHAPMYGRVLRFVGGIRDGLGATEGPAPPEELLARVRKVSSAARAALVPEVLPNIDRLADLTGKFHRQVHDIATPLVLIGDGGLGKSVLLGQIDDAVAALDDSVAILLPCNRIPAATPLNSAAQIDLALGAVAVDRRDAPPLTELLTQLGAAATTYILIDTIDLVVRDDNADAVATVLGELAESHRVVWSCRDLEWHTYLRAAPEVNVSQYAMPLLDAGRIEAWARAYVATATDLAAGVAESFIDSLVGQDSSPRVREVCNTPLRLAMACEVYVGDGGIPEDLSVTELYERYWGKCVASDRRGLGPRSVLARRQVRAAEALAREIWDESVARFALSVTGDSVADDEAMNLLLSEAVVVPFGGRFGFFHQTFGEYAVARRLARVGDRPDFARLLSGLRGSKVPAYWPIARHLIMLEMDDERYAQVCAAIPLSEVEGGKIQLLGAFNRRSADDVIAVAERIREISPELLESNASVLALAPPECRSAAMRVLIDCVRAVATKSLVDGDTGQRGDEKSLSPVVVAAGELQRRFSVAEQRAVVVGDMLDAIISCRAVMTEATTASVMRRFVGDVLQEGPVDRITDALVQRYRSLLPATQREIIRAVAAGPADPRRDRDLLVAAREFPCPERGVDELTAVLLRAWPDFGFRQRMGWSTWRDILESRMPIRWDACQIRVVADLCRDRETAEAVLRVATQGVVDDDISDRYINITKFIADHHREAAVRTVLTLPTDLTTTAIGVVCEIITHTADLLPSEQQRREVIGRLLSWIGVVPRTVWPATIKAAGAHHALLDERITALAGYRAQGGNATVIGSSVDTFLNTLAVSPATLSVYADRLRAMCGGSDVPNRCRRARLDGLTCLVSGRERERIRAYIDDRSARVASSAATAVAFAVRNAAAAELDEDLGVWLFELLGSPYPNTRQTIAEALHAVADRIAWSSKSADTAADLLQDSLRRCDDPQAAKSLVTLLFDISRSSPLEPALATTVVHSLRGTVLDLLPTSVPERRRRDLPAIFGIYKQSLTAVAIPHLPLDDIQQLVLEDLVTIDVGAIAGRAERPLADLLTRLARLDARFLTRLEEVWPLTSPENKYAIGKCVKNIEVGTAGSRSLALARRPDCPAAVKAMIYRTFG